MADQTPITPDEAEKLAVKMVGEYLTACRMTERAQIGNYLMKLTSVVGVVMANAEGSQAAAERLHGTAEFVANNMPRKPARIERMQ